MEQAVIRLVEETAHRHYGKYRGFVADNRDPDERGRLKLTIPSVLGNSTTDWALPCLPFGGNPNHGFFYVPEEGAQVWVEFEEGDLQRPIWTGTFWQKSSDVPQTARKAEPTTRLIKTPSGHSIRFDDAKDEERVTLAHTTGAELVMDPHGSVSLTDADGARVEMDTQQGTITAEDTNGNRITLSNRGMNLEDSNGNRIEMTANGVVVHSKQIVLRGDQVMLGGMGGEPLLKGLKFLTKFMSHTHFVTPIVGGQSSPPIPQGEFEALSTTVTST